MTRSKEKVDEHIKEFNEILDKNRAFSNDERTFVLAFDTELFGHWWHEGVDWLSGLLQYRLKEEIVA